MPAHKVWYQARDCIQRRSGVHYQFRVRGRLSTTLLAAFPELRVQELGAETLLAGQLPDQAALFGVLVRIEALGLELLAVLGTEDR
jgi:hypothetical protein